MSSIRTRSAIIEAATHLFIERGFSDVAMEEIAGEVGISRQGLYLHFRSRNALLEAVAEQIDEERAIGELTSSVLAKPDAMETFRALIDFHVGYLPRIYPLAIAIYAAGKTGKDAAFMWNNRMAAMLEFYAAVTHRLADEGRLLEPWTVEEATELLWTVLSLHTYEQLVIERGWPLDRYRHHLETVLNRVLIIGNEP
jgi:AcrR family transcriptional regulator